MCDDGCDGDGCERGAGDHNNIDFSISAAVSLVKRQWICSFRKSMRGSFISYRSFCKTPLSHQQSGIIWMAMGKKQAC